MNKLDQAREQVFYADVTAQLAAARQRASSEREALIRWLGLWGGGLEFKLRKCTSGAAAPTAYLDGSRTGSHSSPRGPADRPHGGVAGAGIENPRWLATAESDAARR